MSEKDKKSEEKQATKKEPEKKTKDKKTKEKKAEPKKDNAKKEESKKDTSKKDEQKKEAPKKTEKELEEEQKKAEAAYQKQIQKKKKNLSLKSLKQHWTPKAARIKADTSSIKLTTPTKEKSKSVVQGLFKDMFNESGIMQSRKAKKEKQKREKAIADAKKKGIPLAPNGLAYEENDIKYLTKNGYTKEQAYAELAKQEKYTKGYLEAPNGSFYQENDIKYLTDHGYTRDDAIKYLSKCPKYKKMTPGDIKASNKEVIKSASQKFVAGQVNKILDVEVDKIAAQYGIKTKWDDETKAKVRAMIRGEANVVFANDKIIQSAVATTEKELNNFFDKRLKSDVGDAFDLAADVGNKALKKVQSFEKYRTKLTEKDITKLLEDPVGKQVNKLTKLGGVGSKVTSLDNKLSKFGVDLGLSKQMNGALKGVTENISKQLATKLQPKITQEIKLASVVTQKLETYKKYVADVKKKALARIDEWKKEAKEKIKAEEQRIIKNALGSLSSKLGGKIKLKF